MLKYYLTKNNFQIDKNEKELKIKELESYSQQITWTVFTLVQPFPCLCAPGAAQLTRIEQNLSWWCVKFIIFLYKATLLVSSWS